MSAEAATGRRRGFHPVMMFIPLFLAAVALTWLIPSGQYERSPKGEVRQNGFHLIVKELSPAALWHPGKGTVQLARPASLVDIVGQIPVGFVRQAGLIFMIMFIGGTFSVLRATGAIDALIDYLLSATRNNAYLVTAMVMLVLSTGSTLLGLTSEYLVMIPITSKLAEKLKLPHIYSVAVVFCAAKIGYMSAVANPLPLAIAQPIVGLPVFSGLAYRFLVWVVLLGAATLFLMFFIRRSGWTPPPVEPISIHHLKKQHIATLATMLCGIAVIVIGTGRLHWNQVNLTAFYVVFSAAIGIVGGLGANRTIDAFIDGLKGLCLAAVLIGLAGTLYVILGDSYVIDTIIHTLAQLMHGKSPAIVAQSLMGVQMALDLLIPSTTAQAAITMPIVGPLALLGGVRPQVSVLAFLLGSGVMAFMAPTSAYLPAYLATGHVSYSAWMRFIIPFVLILAVLCSLLVGIASFIGY